MTMQGSFGSGGEVVFNLRIDTSQAALDTKALMISFNKLEAIALRYLAIARNMGLPDDVDAAISTIARLIIIIKQVQLALNLLMLSTPYGWVMGVASILLIGSSAVDTMGSFV